MTTSVMAELIGVVAGALTTLSFLPQVLKVVRHRETAGISLAMYAIFTAGVLLWLIYGFLVSSVAVIAANAVTLGLAFTILMLKLRFP
jgi:MtN3 and saliva related transmembrane protein